MSNNPFRILANSIPGFITPDPSAPLGSFQNPYPAGYPIDAERRSSNPSSVSCPVHGSCPPASQSRRPSPHPVSSVSQFDQTRYTPSIPPVIRPEPQASNLTHRPSTPPPILRIQPPPQNAYIASRNVHFNSDPVDHDHDDRARLRRDNLARLEALRTSNTDTSRSSRTSLSRPQQNAVLPTSSRQLPPRTPSPPDPFTSHLLPEPPIWPRCELCNDEPHVIKQDHVLYCKGCFGDRCIAEKAKVWELCVLCEERPGIRDLEGVWTCRECVGEAWAAEKRRAKEEKKMGRRSSGR